MPKLTSIIHRLVWLIIVELRYKLMTFTLMFIVCFALLLLYYWNPTLQISFLLNELLGFNDSFSSVISRSYSVNGIVYSYTIDPSQVNLKYHITYFSLAYYGLGLAVVSVLFREYGDSQSNCFHLSIPASPHEKWFSKLVIAFVVYPLIFLSIYQLFALLTYQWGAMRGYDYVRLHLTDPLIWYYVAKYVFIAAIVIGAATFFRRRGILKICVFIIITYFILGLILNLMVLILFPEFDMSKMANYFSLEAYHQYIQSNHYSMGEAYLGIKSILTSSIALFIGALVSLTYSYLKYYELEG